jgi:hypothetical protein
MIRDDGRHTEKRTRQDFVVICSGTTWRVGDEPQNKNLVVFTSIFTFIPRRGSRQTCRSAGRGGAAVNLGRSFEPFDHRTTPRLCARRNRAVHEQQVAPTQIRYTNGFFWAAKTAEIPFNGGSQLIPPNFHQPVIVRVNAVPREAPTS